LILLLAVIFNSPWYFYFISVALALAVALWLYARNQKNKEVSPRIILVLFTLRLLSTAFIAFLLLNIFLKRLQNQTENPVILVALDNSTSMVSGSDSIFIKRDLTEKLEQLRKKIGEKYEVKTLLFGDKSRLNETAATFSDKETDIDNLLLEVDNNYSGQNIGALIVVSDGISNKGSNPIYAAEKLNFPIYTIATGDTTENKDASIQKVNHNQIAYLGNNFPVEVAVGAKKLKNQELTVGLFQNGVLKAEQKLKASSDNFSGLCNFTLSASNAGLVRYQVSILPVGGEKNLSNNNQSFVIEVIDNRDKILLLGNAPHPDFAAIRESLAGFGNYELDFGLYESFNKPLKAYSLIILMGVGNAQQSVIADCKNNAVPFLIVNPLTSENLPGVKVATAMNRNNDAEPYMVNSFGLFAMSDAFKKFVADLPAVKTFFGNYSIVTGSSSLLNQKIGSVETENPIFLFGEVNGLKYGVFMGDGLWRWKMRDFEAHHNHDLFNELIGKSVQYLAVKSDKSLFRVSAPKIVRENENVEFEAEVYNKSYELITEPDVTLTLINADKKKFNYTFSKAGNSYRLNVGQLAPGDYNFEAGVNNNGQLMTKKGMISIKEILAEKINTVADHKLLYQLANRSGGKLFYPNQFEQLEETLMTNERIKPITYSQNNISSLIEFKWLIVIILTLLASEWVLRKAYLHI
jgi:hypothetical protein